MIPNFHINYNAFTFSADSITCEIKCEKQKSQFITYEEYCEDLILCPLNGKKICISNPLVSEQKHELKLRPQSVSKYKKFRDKNIMTLHTMLSVALDSEEYLKKLTNIFITSESIEMLFKESIMTNFGFAQIGVRSDSEKLMMMLFMSFLNSGFFLFPFKPNNNKVNLPQHVTIEEYPPGMPGSGGHIYSKGGVFRNCVHIDFIGFYSSIITTYKLTFSTISILKEKDLETFLSSRPYMRSKILIFKHDLEPGVMVIILKRKITDKKNIFHSGVFTLFDELLKQRAMTKSVAWSAKLKKFASGLTGCFASPNFEYNSLPLYNTLTFLGRHIIRFITDNIHLFIDNYSSVDIFQQFTSYSAIGKTFTNDNIVNVQTDGFVLRCDDNFDSKALVKNINNFCNLLAPTNEIKCCLKYTTPFLVDVCKNKCYYKSGKQFFGPKMDPEIKRCLMEIEKDPLCFAELYKLVNK